jgi:hypothetical protein
VNLPAVRPVEACTVNKVRVAQHADLPFPNDAVPFFWGRTNSSSPSEWGDCDSLF